MPWMPYLLRDTRHRAFRSEAGGVQVGESAAHLVDGVGVKTWVYPATIWWDRAV